MSTDETAVEQIQRLNRTSVSNQFQRDAEIFTSEGKDIDFDYLNFEYDKTEAKQITKSVTKNKRDPDVVFEEHKFNQTQDRMQKISQEVIEQRNQVFQSRQAAVAGKLMRIRAEIKDLERQIKNS